MKTLLIPLLGCFLLASCASGPGPFRAKNLTHISIGMTKPEVLQILGEPKSVGAGDNVEIFHYWDEERGWWQHDNFYIRFASGKVESYGPEPNDRPVTPSEPSANTRQ